MPRGNYFGVSVGCALTVFLANLFYEFGKDSSRSGNLGLALLASVAVAGAYYVQSRSASRRFRDSGWSPWTGLILLVPLLNLLLIALMCFLPSRPSASTNSRANLSIDELDGFGASGAISKNTDADHGSGSIVMEMPLNFFQRLVPIVGIAAFFGYLLLGLFQMAACVAGIENWLGWHWMLAAPIAIFVSYTSIAGTIAGVLGAVYGWSWDWLEALALFFAPFVVIFTFGVISTFFDTSSSRGRGYSSR